MPRIMSKPRNGNDSELIEISFPGLRKKLCGLGSGFRIQGTGFGTKIIMFKMKGFKFRVYY